MKVIIQSIAIITLTFNVCEGVDEGKDKEKWWPWKKFLRNRKESQTSTDISETNSQRSTESQPSMDSSKTNSTTTNTPSHSRRNSTITPQTQPKEIYTEYFWCIDPKKRMESLRNDTANHGLGKALPDKFIQEAIRTINKIIKKTVTNNPKKISPQPKKPLKKLPCDYNKAALIKPSEKASLDPMTISLLNISFWVNKLDNHIEEEDKLKIQAEIDTLYNSLDAGNKAIYDELKWKKN